MQDYGIHGHNHQYSPTHGPLGLGNGPKGTEGIEGKGDPKDTAKANGDDVKTTQITNLLVELFGDMLTQDATSTGKTTKSKEPTSMHNVLDAPVASKEGKDPAKVDMAKLLSMFQMLNTEQQLKLAKDCVERLKSTIKARCKQQLEKVDQSIKKWQDAEAKRKAALITAWASLAVATAALAAAIVCNVLSCGLGTPAVVAAGIAVAAAAATVALLEKPSIMNKLIGGIADMVQGIDKLFGGHMNRKTAKNWAQGIMMAAIVAITVASIATSWTNPTNAAMCIGRLVQLGTSIAQGALGMASAGVNLAATIDNYQAAKLQIELKQIQQFLTKLQQRLEDDQEAMQSIMKLLMNCVNCIMDSMKSQNSAVTEILTNLGQNFA